MPVTLTLQENGRILYWKFSDPWEIQELTNNYPQVKIYFDQSTHPIHSLVDFEGVHKLPSNALSARQTPNWNHPNGGHTAIVGGTIFVRSMLETAFRLMRFNRIRFFEHETEARAYLLQLETSPRTDRTDPSPSAS